MRFSPTPEAIAYLRLLGNEIGYMKASEMRKLVEILTLYYHVFGRVLPFQVRFVVSWHELCKRKKQKNVFLFLQKKVLFEI